MTHEQTREELHQACRFLAGHCDGAQMRDNMGFNAPDAGLGHYLAEIDGSAWSKAQVCWAYYELRKYKDRQLVGVVNWEELEKPEFVFGYSLIARNDRWAQICQERERIRQERKEREKQPTTLTREGNTIRVSFPYDAGLVAAIKECPGRRFDGSNKTWLAPLTLDVLEPLAAFAEHAETAIPEDILTELLALAEKAEQVKEASRAMNAAFDVPGLGGTLRPFQQAGVAYAVEQSEQGGVLISDEMGCGKTIEALATLQAKQAFPAIIICPASLKLNWAKEVKQWLPGRSYAVWNGKQQGGSDIVIINYDIVKKHGEKLATLGAEAVILDESHYCKNGKALRTKAVAALAKNIPLKLALTGTPVLNRPSELISQLDILGRLGDLGGFWPFAKRYCHAFKGRWGWDFSGADNLEELNEKLRTSCMVRRLKKDVLSELPAKQRTEIPLEITNRREYDKAERELIAWLRQNAIEDKAFLASLKGLSEEEKKRARHAKADSAEMAARRAEQLVKIEALKQLAWKGKMAGAISWVTDTLESEKLVLFCWHKEAVEALREEFKCPVITGEVSVEERQRAVEKFQSDETCRLIVLNIRAGGVGLTLTAASNVAFLEMGWTPADHDQAEDRCHRMGQTDQVTAWYLIGERTIDERIMALVNEKRAIVEQATDGTGEGGNVSVLKELVRDLMA